MLVNAPPVRAFFGMPPTHALWLGIQPLSAGVFGVPVGFGVIALVSLVSKPRPAPAPALR
jgi:cation/acetate symporter